MRCQTGFGSVPAGAYEDILLNGEVMSAGVLPLGALGGQIRRCACCECQDILLNAAVERAGIAVL